MGWYFKHFETDRQDLIDIQQNYINFFEEYVIRPVIKKYLDACMLLDIENDVSRKLKDLEYNIPEKCFRGINNLVALSFRWLNYNSCQDLFTSDSSYSELVINEWRNYNIELGNIFLNNNHIINSLVRIVIYSQPSTDEPENAEEIFHQANDNIYWFLFHILKIPNSCHYYKLKMGLIEKYGTNENIDSSYFNSPKLPAPSVLEANFENK